MKTRALLSFILVSFLLMNIASALTINSIHSDTLSPGNTGRIEVEIENTLEIDVQDVSLRLDLTNLPFTPIGSSEDSFSEIQEGDEENFIFNLKASNDIVPGDYKIPFALTYEDDSQQKTRQGSIGLTVKANPQLTFSVFQENNIVGQEGKITLKIINSGFSDAKFVYVRIFPDGYTLKSEDQIYIGSVDSDDFESETFDVILNNKNAIFTAVIEYKDFDNEKITETVNVPLTVYTNEEAIKLGIIKKNYTLIYIIIVVVLIILWLVYRSIRKRIRAKRKKQAR